MIEICEKQTNSSKGKVWFDGVKELDDSYLDTVLPLDSEKWVLSIEEYWDNHGDASDDSAGRDYMSEETDPETVEAKVDTKETLSDEALKWIESVESSFLDQSGGDKDEPSAPSSASTCKASTSGKDGVQSAASAASKPQQDAQQPAKGKGQDAPNAHHREPGVQERRSRMFPDLVISVSEWREGNGPLQHHYQVRSGPMQEPFKADEKRNYHLPMNAYPMRQPTAAAVVAGLHGYGGVKRKPNDPPGQSVPRVTFHSSVVKYVEQKGNGKDKSGGKELVDSAGLKFEDCLEVKPRPRRRSWGQGSKQTLGGRPQNDQDASIVPVKLSTDLLRQHFNMPLNEAARKLGICATAIKKVCRKMGIRQWPFQRLKPIQRRLAKLRGQPCVLPEVAMELEALEAKRAALLAGRDIDDSDMKLDGSQSD
uniref:RWP-RK domain-containing protein n=1 Tax=Guillardia theta TaxID=55529 RepID=A0A6U6DVB2_GUITH|mmetsp:Transcript_7583/g.25800  ORF Transcript_7583/g.25800 Transcript_7583/m.25800 type:complete len:424 (+) Transcript_7583:293-1564(+)